MLVNLKKMMEDAKNNKKAIAQLNINNLEWAKYILEVANELNSPVILGVSEGATKYMGGYNTVVNMVKGLIFDLDIKVNVAIHLDHASSFASCKKAIDAGYTSVMIDASKYELIENIRLTKEVVSYAHPKGVTVEAEVGSVGGVEDEVNGGIKFAKEEDAIMLANQTGIDLIAPALGSVHGLYEGKPNIQFDTMKKISEKTNMPLVLHGGTGLPDKDIIKAIENGTTKININTELQIDWNKAVREFISKNEEHDPRKVIGAGEEALKNAARKKITLFQNN